MSKYLYIILAVCLSFTVKAQENSLDAYLLTHQSVIERNTDGTLNRSKETEAILSKSIKGRKLFVFGEGCSHFLYLNGDLRILLANYLSQHGLKYIFEEGARSWAMEDNFFMEHPNVNADSYYYPENEHYRNLHEQQRNIYAKNNFEIVGVDFERAEGLHKELAVIMHSFDDQTKSRIYSLAPYVQDTGYLHFTSKEFKGYYKKIQADFYEDSASLKPLLGARYLAFKNLLSNSNINTPYGSRNKPMAENLLEQIDVKDTTAMYLLDCGMDHSRPNIKGSLANILSESDKLKNKIVVMNVVCDSCTTEVEPTSNWAFPVMKDKVLESFKRSAKGNVVLFDLSDLPAEYSAIKEYGDLLVLAQHQH